MELKDFVAETLKQIIDGVMVAQEHAEDTGAVVAAGEVYPRASFKDVEFDVAVTKTEGGEAQASIGVLFSAVGLGGKTKYEAAAEAVNRIRFSVPIRFPLQKR